MVDRLYNAFTALQQTYIFDGFIFFTERFHVSRFTVSPPKQLPVKQPQYRGVPVFLRDQVFLLACLRVCVSRCCTFLFFRFIEVDPQGWLKKIPNVSDHTPTAYPRYR